MCGIAGIYNYSGSVNKDMLLKMTNVLKHRGPDGDGHWINDKRTIGFGHRRLSIIDLSNKGKQPMHFYNDRYTITFNGEIYNYLELKKELLNDGLSFVSESDTEVLLALYHKYKTLCLQKLDGMFSFAIWDNVDEILFCARDRFGEKPFYYHIDDKNIFYFASEMKALWAIGIIKEIDPLKLESFLNGKPLLDADNLSSTFYKNISQLDAGHFIFMNKGTTILQNNYYNLSHVKQLKKVSHKEVAEEVFRLFSNSVKIRLRSDVPVGSSLSGGLDSSCIVKIIEQLKPNNYFQNTFSARFNNFDKDEGAYISEIVKSIKHINAYEVWPNMDDMMNEMDTILYHQEEPFESASIFAQWKVMELAKRQNVIVLLDGQGADEYFAGYTHYFTNYTNQLYFTNKKKYKNEVEHYNFLRNNVEEIKKRDRNLMQNLSYYKNLLTNKKVDFGQLSLQERLKNDTMVNGLKVLLRFADRNSMAHSREIRLPFLDHKLVEFVLSLPDDYKLQNGISKWILRHAMRAHLPAKIINRVTKVGYEVPQHEWLDKIVTEKIKNTANEYISDAKIKLYNNVEITNWNYFMLSKIIN